MSLPERSLTDCYRCDAPFLDVNNAVDKPWAELPGNKWLIQMICRECDWFGRIIASDAEVDEYDRLRDIDMAKMLKEANRRRDETTETIAKKFGDALRNGNILPEDF